MPDKRQHRGAHPGDMELFAPCHLDRLRAATADLAWLLSHGYAIRSSLQLVGDRYELLDRQRLAISRAACSDVQKAGRGAGRLTIERVRDHDVFVDGFNVIITTEAALGGGVLFRGRDGCIRDLSSVHGSYRAVQETERAIGLIGESLQLYEPRSVRWLLDKPISNSGRLAQKIRDLAERRGWNWSVEVVFNPDAELATANGIVVTSDSAILDRGVRWVNFNEHLVSQLPAAPWLVDLAS